MKIQKLLLLALLLPLAGCRTDRIIEREYRRACSYGFHEEVEDNPENEFVYKRIYNSRNKRTATSYLEFALEREWGVPGRPNAAAVSVGKKFPYNYDFIIGESCNRLLSFGAETQAEFDKFKPAE